MCVFQKIFRFYSLLRFPPTLLLQPICGSPHIPPIPCSSPVPRAPPAILRWVMTWVGSESVMDRSWSRWLNDCARSAGGERRNTLRMGGAGELLFAPAGGEIVRRKYQGYFRGPSPVDSCVGIENCRRGDGGKSWLLCFLIEDHILDFKNAPSFLSSIRMWEISVPICILSALMSFSVGPAEGISALISCSLRLKFSWKVRWAE